MAVLARAQITLSAVVDIQAVYKYYKLQSSTSTKPSKPTSISTLPPSGWTATEPTYTSGSTNTLYTVELTVFTDGSFSYADVMTDSSYEAAKAAYNKAVAAANAASAAQDDIDAQKEWFWHDNAGAHVLGDTSGYRNDLNSTGMHIVDISNGVDVARFGASGAQIGKDDESHVLLDSESMSIVYEDKEIAHFGYGDTAGEEGRSDAPYFTLGKRIQDIGGYSTAEGYGVEASGYNAHAEGFQSKASGGNSHSEGSGTTASGQQSHAEGYNTVASGIDSHAQNSGTVAASSAQTAMGRNNVIDSAQKYAVIVGNGGSDASRSNAATLDWDGNLELAGQVQQTPEIIEAVTPSLAPFTVSTLRVVKCGNICTFTLELALTGALSDWVEVATGLPAPYGGAVLDTATNWGTSYTRPLRVSVGSAGNVQVRYGAATTYRITMTYICV